MSWGVFPDGRTGLSSLLDPVLESSPPDPLWSLLCSTLYWSLLHLTLSGVSFARPSTKVFFTWLSMESSLLDPLLKSSSFDSLWSLLCSTLCWNLRHLTLFGVFFARPSAEVFFTWPSGVFFARPSTGIFFTWPFLESPLLYSLLESSVWVSQSVSLVSQSRLALSIIAVV